MPIVYVLLERSLVPRYVLERIIGGALRIVMKVMLPALADRKGGAVLCGTPKGFNWFYELYSYAEAHPEWSVHHSTTLEGGLVPEGELNQARELMDERLFKQEFEASFEKLGNRGYRQFDRRIKIGGKPPEPPLPSSK